MSTEAAPRSAEPLVVCTWNVLADRYVRAEYYPHLLELPAPGSRRGAVAAVAADLARRCDVFCAQEVDEGTAEAVTSALGAGWLSHFEVRPNGRVEGSLVAARTRLRPLFRSGSAGVADHRWVSATLTVAGRSVTVAGTHLPWAPEGTGDHPGVVCVEHLGGVLPADAVLTGDLNAGLGSEVFDALTLAGFCTAPVAPSSTAVVNGADPAALDWVFARGALSVEELCLPVPAAAPLPTASFPSDHVPVLATVSVTPPT